ncbi:uncharacterized mitochondrial protein AtMg00810-like [Quercus suber]|uniref:uncharacterized mitochondrial protein AtMg00810-like n=1 Tax=Quercus suber TaxID=58331 RepID=UPI0032DFA5A1
MKDLGTLSYFLGLEVTSSSDGYYLSQAKYVSDLLSKAGITNNKTISTPLEYNVKLTPLDGEPISDATRYRQLVGSLIYFTVTRLDISHAVGMVSKFMDGPRFVHYAAVLRILRYVKGTFYHGLHYSSWSSLELYAIQMRTGQVIRLIDALSQVFVSCWPTATPFYCDNRSAIYIAHNDVFYERTKHIEIDCHITRQHLKKGNLKLFSISSAD